MELCQVLVAPLIRIGVPMQTLSFIHSRTQQFKVKADRNNTGLLMETYHSLSYKRILSGYFIVVIFCLVRICEVRCEQFPSCNFLVANCETSSYEGDVAYVEISVVNNSLQNAIVSTPLASARLISRNRERGNGKDEKLTFPELESNEPWHVVIKPQQQATEVFAIGIFNFNQIANGGSRDNSNRREEIELPQAPLEISFSQPSITLVGTNKKSVDPDQEFFEIFYRFKQKGFVFTGNFNNPAVELTNLYVGDRRLVRYPMFPDFCKRFKARSSLRADSNLARLIDFEEKYVVIMDDNKSSIEEMLNKFAILVSPMHLLERRWLLQQMNDDIRVRFPDLHPEFVARFPEPRVIVK